MPDLGPYLREVACSKASEDTRRAGRIGPVPSAGLLGKERGADELAGLPSCCLQYNLGFVSGGCGLRQEGHAVGHAAYKGGLLFVGSCPKSGKDVYINENRRTPVSAGNWLQAHTRGF